MSRVASKSRPLPCWRITRIKASPAVELGTVEAPDADTAIRVAIKEFEVTNPEHQMCLAARRVERTNDQTHDHRKTRAHAARLLPIGAPLRS